MLKLGQKVRISNTGEVCVVAWVWIDEHGDEDVLVVCFGEEYPTGEPVGPNLMRYYGTSLEAFED